MIQSKNTKTAATTNSVITAVFYIFVLCNVKIASSPPPARAAATAAAPDREAASRDREEKGIKKEHLLNSFQYIVLRGGVNVNGKSPIYRRLS
ncbi:MAG: hypothetical protein WBJ70_07725 [Bacilli bacterium]